MKHATGLTLKIILHIYLFLHVNVSLKIFCLINKYVNLFDPNCHPYWVTCTYKVTVIKKGVVFYEIFNNKKIKYFVSIIIKIIGYPVANLLI